MQLIHLRGISLVELLLSLTLGLIITAAASHLFSAIARSRMTSISRQHLHQELETLLNRISRDLRRSGHAGHNAFGDLLQAHNPFFIDHYGQTLLSLHDIENKDQDSNSYDCILLAYDANENGLDDGNDERFGYRFTENTVKIRSGGGNCQQSGWIRISDDQTLSITRLSFRPLRYTTGLNDDWIRCSILIELEAAVLTHPEQSLQLAQWVTLPNRFRAPLGSSGQAWCQ